jgi:RNA polymerase sigma-70 factor (ECF subfamily)
MPSKPRQTDQIPEHEAAAVARARDGDSEAFRLLVERHSRSVYKVAFRVTGNRDDAEDVVQETFLKAFRQLDRFEARSSFGTWLHRIAWNCSVDLLRSRPKREQAQEADTLEQLGSTHMTATGTVAASPERLMASVQVSDRVKEAMGRLSPLERAAFVMRHYEGRSIDEISRALSIRENAAKHSIFRAVRKMRVALEPFV